MAPFCPGGLAGSREPLCCHGFDERVALPKWKRSPCPKPPRVPALAWRRWGLCAVHCEVVGGWKHQRPPSPDPQWAERRVVIFSWLTSSFSPGRYSAGAWDNGVGTGREDPCFPIKTQLSHFAKTFTDKLAISLTSSLKGHPPPRPSEWNEPIFPSNSCLGKSPLFRLQIHKELAGDSKI